MWADDEEPELVVYPTINWRAIVPEDTFLFEYMNACCNDDSPEEFHFWHGLLALGNAVGRKVYLSDNPHVRPNLMVCLLGNTGAGKSKSRRYLMEVLREGAPYREDGSSTSGVKQLARPGSGEVLVADLRYEGKDPATSRPLGPQPVNGIVDFDELSVIAAVAARQGSTLTTTLMQIADAVPDIKITSMKNGLMTASEPFCNVTASTQPRAIRNVVGRADASSGFLNRWIFAGGKEKEPEAIGGKHSSTRIELTRAIELFNHVRGWGSFEREIEMDDDAYQLFEDFFRNFIVPTKRKDETDLLKRVDLIFKKLMLLLTINQKLEKVPLQVVQATVKLFDYVIECYGILNSNIGISMMQDVMNDIQNHINRHVAKTKRGASARDIARYTHRKNYSLEQIKKALDTMTALDIIELEPKPPGPGRPTARYRVVGE
jgi:energy-coupling factor transporter ATP-binding protein EcfA2